jgi:hypothetical protein
MSKKLKLRWSVSSAITSKKSARVSLAGAHGPVWFVGKPTTGSRR